MTGRKLFVRLLGASAMLHVLVLAGVFLIPHVEDRKLPPVSPGTPVKIRIQVNSEHGKVKDPPRPTAPKTKRPILKEAVNDLSREPAPLTYDSLLPAVAGPLDGSGPSARSHQDDSLMNTRWAKGGATQNEYGSTSELLLVARSLHERWALPSALQKEFASAKARLVLRRRVELWTISRAEGDPWFRAFLFEEWKLLSAQSYELQILRRVKLDRITIELEFVRDHQPKFDESQYLASEDTIRLMKYRAKPEGNFLVSEEAGWNGKIYKIDLFGLFDKIKDAKGGLAGQRDLKKYGESAAFLKPWVMTP